MIRYLPALGEHEPTNGYGTGIEGAAIGVLKKAVQEFVVDKFDHGFLNEYLEYPTCENMCKWIWAQLSPYIKGLSLVKVQETDGSYCTFSENA